MFVHDFPIRVYFEDTDAAGVVFYANYLKYTERARTEFLRSIGVNHGAIVSDENKSFVVRQCTIDYLHPAILDDQLIVHTQIESHKGAKLILRQFITRDKDILVDTFVTLVFVDLATMRPVRIWDSIINTLQSIHKEKEELSC